MDTRSKRHTEDVPAVVKWVRPVLVGIAVGIVVCAVTLMMLAAVIAAVDIPQGAVTPMAVAAASLAAFFAGFACSKAAGSNGLVYGAVCGIGLYVIVMLAGLIIFKDLRGVFALAKLLIMAGLGGVGGIVGVNTKNKRK